MRPLSAFQRWPGRIGAVLTALACACLCTGPAWSQAALVPNAIQQFFDANGNPLSSGFVYFYVPGTTSPKTVWQDAGQTIPYSNPIQLNAAGEPNTAAGIWGAGNYRQIVQDQLQNLVWDAVTSTPGTSSGGGGTSGDGMPIGFIMAYAGPSAPTGYDFAYGQSYLRSGFPTLLGALTITQNGTCTNGSGNITALADTSQMGVGQAIESTCLPPGTTISAILSSSSVSVNTLATGISGTYSLRVFPFGNGNGATTFQLPDLRGYGLAGRDNMGGTAANVLTSATRANGWDLLGAVGGVEALTLATSQLPAHSHEILVSDPGHFHVFTYSTSAAGSGGASQTTNIDAFGDATLTNTQAQATGITATAASAGGGIAVSATLGAPTSQALASGTVSFGGGSYTNGASVSLTVTGGTCATQPVVLATVASNKVTAINSVSTPGACTSPPTNPATLSDGTHVSATIVGVYGNGSGYTTGSQVLTVLGGTCTTQPQFTVTVAGGSVTTVNSLTTPGLCVSPPVNPAATSGGGGVGATLAVAYSTRPTAIVQPTVAINYVIKVNTNSGGFTIPIANNTVVGNNSGFTNPPTAITAPAVLAMICNTRGAILENAALGWNCLPPGTNGYALVSNGTGADPTYQPIAGAGGPVTGPGSSVLNGLVCWANAFGTVLENCNSAQVNPTASSLSTGLTVTQSGPTSGSDAGVRNCLADLALSYCFNSIDISADAYNLANSGMNAFAIDYGYGSPNMQGARNGLTVYSHLNSTGDPSNPNPFYASINSVWEGFAPDTSSSAAVNVSAFTLLQTAATGFHSIEGMEVATGMVSSGGAAFRVGLDLASIGAFQGASGDYAVAISANAGDVRWLNGISFNHFNGIAPLDATNGCAICTDGSSDTIKTGMDLSSYTITGNFLKGPGGFLVDGTATLQAKTAFIYGPATGGPAAVVVNNQDGANTSELIFEAAGVPKWEFGKNGSGNFFIFDDVGGANVLSATANGGLAITPVGATTIGSAGVRVNVAGQLVSTAGLPTIASGACGATTNGAVVAGSTNQSGNITIGSASTTTCTIAWSATLPVAPNACVFFPANAAAAATGTTVAFVTPPTTAHVVLNGSALANANYSYVCI